METASTLRWLKLASAIVIGFGILTALAALPWAAGPTVLLTDLILFPLDGGQSLSAAETRILVAILGGVLAGWGVLFWLVATQVYAQHPALGRRLILTSIGIWFCIDCTASVLADAPFNVLLNVPFLAMFVLPLWQKPTSLTTQLH
jgi:hypothetical protein